MEESAGITIYSQLSCPTSYRLYKRLRDEKLLDRVSIVDTGLSPFESLYRGVISVPAIFYGGIMIYSGYFDIDEAVGVIRGGGPCYKGFRLWRGFCACYGGDS
jgi:predicted thioredoxin/glutaredoxin